MSIGLVVLLIFAAIILFLVLWCVWAKRSFQKQNEKAIAAETWYDERQLAAHGDAHRFCASVGGMYMLILYFCFEASQWFGYELRIDFSPLMSGGVWLMMVAYHLYCLMTDSAIPLGKSNITAKVDIVLGVLCFFGGLINITVNRSALNSMIMGTSLFVIGIIHAIARRREKKVSDEH